MKYAPDHPLTDRRGYVSASRLALFGSIGPGAHSCHWCGAAVEWRSGLRGNHDGVLITDHLDGDHLNDEPKNVVPSCWQCNTNRAKTKSSVVGDDEVFITRSNGTRLRGIAKTCAVCAKPFVAQPLDVKRGRGLFCSLSCARTKPKPTP